MRVAVPSPQRPNMQEAFGADFASHRLVAKLREHAANVTLDVLPTRFDSISQLEELDDAVLQHMTAPVGCTRMWDVLHDVRPRGDPRRHFHLRSHTQRRFPIAFTHHALCYPSYLESYFMPLAAARMEECDALVCSSRAAQQAVLRLMDMAREHAAECGHRIGQLRAQVQTIPLGVDTELYRPRETSDLRYQLGVDPEAFVILWHGRLSSATKADLAPLLYAFADLRRRHPDHRMLCILVGSDHENYGAILERIATAIGLQGCLRIVRTTPQIATHLWYGAADVFVSPSDNVQESFGLAVAEAMASGLPQVVSDWSGYRDIVEHGHTGFLARTYWADCDEDAIGVWDRWGDGRIVQELLARSVACDVGDITHFLEILLLAPDVRRRMAIASRQRALSAFAWPAVVGEYVALWRDLIARSTRSEWTPVKPSGFSPAFFGAFGGYASHLLLPTTRIRFHTNAVVPSSVAAAEVPGAGERWRRAHACITDYLMQSGGETTLRELTNAIARVEPKVQQYILFAIKYGFIEVADFTDQYRTQQVTSYARGNVPS